MARPVSRATGPFDVIVLSGSVAEVPQVLMAQVKIGGRLIGIVGDEPMMYATVRHPHRRVHSGPRFSNGTPWCRAC